MTPVFWILLGVGVLLALTPKWTRPDLYFAVTVRPDFAFTGPARRILRRYILEVALHTVIAIALAGLVSTPGAASVMLGIAWQFAGSSWALARARRATLAYAAEPSPVREAIITGSHETLPGGWPVALGPLAFVIAAAVYALLFWEKLPGRIPVHWGVNGPDRWVDRTTLNVFGFLSVLGSCCVIFLVLSYGTVAWSRRICVTGTRGRSERRFRRASLWLWVVLPYLVVVPAIVLAFWTTAPAAAFWPVISMLTVVVSLTVLMRMGQGGSRMAARTEYQPPVGDRTPDAAWKWGMFYYNPDDPALIVEKRFGLGYTINFGNRWSWPATALLLLPAVLALVLS